MTENHFDMLDIYQRDADRTIPQDVKPNNLLLEGVIGLSAEVGECANDIKKHIFQGHDIDRDHVIEELGDVLWYVNLTANSIGASLEDVMRVNMEKRKKRYPDGFDQNKSRNRCQ